ncbi:MAG: glycosyltransferase family 2 protein [Nitrospinae bacterium]|nr:glycosyltransferase family 2 protein [Nitrospinota bacterium]
MAENPLVSVVIPVYRGEKTIGPLVERLISVFAGRRLQIVLVNDASPDNSHAVCLESHEKHPDTVKYIRLARNFGEHNAVMAGLNHAGGDYVIIMDDDFQNPPEEAPKLLEKALEGDFDIVYSQYEDKKHHWFRNLGSRFNDAVANYMLDKPKDLYLSSFKCLSRMAVREIISYKGPFPYIDGIALNITRNIGVVMARHEERASGESGYTFKKLVRLWLSLFFNFSIIPLRTSLIMGFLLSGLGFILCAEIVIEKIFYPGTPLGWAFIATTILIFSGVQLIIIGVLGEYVGRIFLTINNIPQYVVKSAHGTGKRP